MRTELAEVFLRRSPMWLNQEPILAVPEVKELKVELLCSILAGRGSCGTAGGGGQTVEEGDGEKKDGKHTHARTTTTATTSRLLPPFKD